jgi:hypothetical protein
MAPDDNSGAKPAGPVVLRIKLRYDDLEAMVQRFATNVGKSGLFLPTKSIQPIGTEVKFELRLANDTPVLVGLGRVKHVRPPDQNQPKAAFGMAIELMRVSREGREVIFKMLERRKAMGLPEVAIPMPDDLEAARRAEVETLPRADTSALVRETLLPVAPPPAAPLLTSARPGSGPIAIARDERSGRVPVQALRPEKSRPRRPRVQELIDRAAELSSRVVLPTPTPELDMQIDLEHVLSRARALAGGELDVELATLREAAATPIEISVEAASAELAHQLGGKPIARRERSARWEPPPPVEMKSDIDRMPDFAARIRAETEAAPAAANATAVDSAIEARASQLALDTEVVARVSAPVIEQDLATPVDASTPAPPTEPDDDDGFLQRPMMAVEARDAAPTGLMIDDNADVASFERAIDPPDSARSRSEDEAQMLSSGEFQLDDAVGENTLIGETPPEAGPEHLANSIDRHLAQAEAEAERELSDALGRPFGEEEEEVSELDVLAEADEGDEDLLAAHGEADVSGGHAPAPEPYDPYVTPPPVSNPEEDFAARLDLGDEDYAPNEEFDREAAREFDAHVPHVDEAIASLDDLHEPPAIYRHHRAKRASSEPSADYTVAETMAPPSLSFAPHETGEEFDEPHAFPPPEAPAPMRGPDPRVLQHGRSSTEDLEDALAALDVGDIDLEQRRARRPTPSSPRPLPGLPIERPRTGQVPVLPQPAVPPPSANPPRIAHTVPRSALKQPTGQVSTAKPPPIPAAARNKVPTQPAQMVKPSQPNDDGVIIDFDDDLD